MHQQNKSIGLRIYSSSPDSRCSSSCQMRKNPQNNDILKDCLNNFWIHRAFQDPNIINQSSNVTFQLSTLVPTNTPNIITDKQKQVFDFDLKNEATLCFAAQKQETSPSIKMKLLEKIKQMQNLTKEKNPPNYLKNLVSRQFIRESLAKNECFTSENKQNICLCVPSQITTPLLPSKTQETGKKSMEVIQRRVEDPKKKEIQGKANKWTNHFKNLRENDGEIEFQNEIRNNLNKLTPDNYHIIREVILELIQNNQIKCEFFTNKIVEKALTEPKYTKVYAELCLFLQNSKQLNLEDISSKKKKNIFKSSLLGKIQSLFETEVEDNSSNEEDKNNEKLKKKRKIGMIKFIAELFIMKVLPEIIIQICATALVLKAYSEFMGNGPNNYKFESNIECLIQLYDIVGKSMESVDEKHHVQTKNSNLIKIIKSNFGSNQRMQPQKTSQNLIFSFLEILNILEFLMEKAFINKRLQILIKNLCEKRKANWKEGIFSHEIPKKISELHREYKQEQDLVNMKINPQNKIAMSYHNQLDKKLIHSSFISTETKSTESGSPRSTSNNLEVEKKIKKYFQKYRLNEKNSSTMFGKDQIYDCLKKLCSSTSQKKLIISKFLEEFYNDRAQKVEQILFIPFRLYEEKCLNKKEFIASFNQSFNVIWQDFGDNPKLLEYLSLIYFDFIAKHICTYENFKVDEQMMSENEEFLEAYNKFLEMSLNLVKSKCPANRESDNLKSSLKIMIEKSTTISK